MRQGTFVLGLVAAGLGGFAAVMTTQYLASVPVEAQPPGLFGGRTTAGAAAGRGTAGGEANLPGRLGRGERPEEADELLRGAASGESVPTAPSQLYDGLTPEERVNVAVYEKCNRSVVNITTKAVRTERIFFEVPAEGAGSGSILNKSGHVLTNFHVVSDARQIRVTLFNGSNYEAGVVGVDPVNDIAVLKIDAPPEVLHPVELGESHNLRVGQNVYAIGNPFGLERTLTRGIVSSLDRTLPSRDDRTIKSVIQIDAALNRGNSGGPLMNSRGQVIGMNTAIASSTGENTGIGFAVPVGTIRRIVPQLIETGRVVRPYIGIAQVLPTDKGLLVHRIVPGSPADRAGVTGFKTAKRTVQRGPFVYEESYLDDTTADLIVGIDGTSVSSADDFMTVIESKQPGDTARLSVIRGGERRTVEVRLTAPPE